MTRNIPVRDFVVHTSRKDRSTSVAKSKMWLLLNGEIPTEPQRKTVEAALDKLGIPVNGVWKKLSAAEIQKLETPAPKAESNKPKPKEVTKMAGQRLWPNTIERFKITDHGKKAFIPRIDSDNVYKTPDYNKLESTLIEAIKEQDTFCLIGPRGCGKSTLLNATIKKHFPERAGKYAIKIIRMFSKDIAKTTVHNILVALCRGAGTKLKGGDHEEQSWFTYQALAELRKGTDAIRPVFVIEDAHLLHVKIIVALKQFMEMETDAGERALGIIMLAQEPMELKMGPGTEQLWERCYTVTFPPLVLGKDAGELTSRNLKPLKGYIEFRLNLAGLDPAKIFKGNMLVNLCKSIAAQGADYPLMVNNAIVKALNSAAATVKENPQITAAHIGNFREA